MKAPLRCFQKCIEKVNGLEILYLFRDCKKQRWYLEQVHVGLRDGDSIYSTMKNKGDDFNKDFVCLFVLVVPEIRLRVPYIVDPRQAIYH